MYDLLAILGISEPNVVGKMLEDMYFYDWQIGSQEDMTPGIVDVRFISHLCFIMILVSEEYYFYSLEAVSC